MQAAQHDGRHDFDFYVGTWKVHNRRLRERLKGSDDWEEFDAISIARPILGGVGNFDEITLERELGPGYGLTIRLFDPASGEWSLYWASSAGGPIFPPMVGRFELDGRGYFYAHETFEGRHIFSRFIWSNISATTARWEQAFSTDGGQSWETNWTMDSVKVSE